MASNAFEIRLSKLLNLTIVGIRGAWIAYLLQVSLASIYVHEIQHKSVHEHIVLTLEQI